MVPNARKAPTQAGLITRSAYSAEPSRRAAPERRTARQGRPSGRAPGTAIGGCRACAAVGRAPRTRKDAFIRPPRRTMPQDAERPARDDPPAVPARPTMPGGGRMRRNADRPGREAATSAKRGEARRGDLPRGPLPAHAARAAHAAPGARTAHKKSALRERDALPSRSLALQYSRRRRA